MMRIRTLGEASIQIGSNQVGPDSAVMFGSLLFLAFHAGRPVGRERLREILWPDINPPDGAHSLRQLLYRMRRLGAPITSTLTSITLIETALIADFAPYIRVDPERPEISSGLPNGAFLEGYAADFSNPFAAWIDEQRAVVHGRIRHSLLSALKHSRSNGDARSLEDLARAILRIDPLNEEATLSLAEATALAGNKADAVGMLDKYLSEIGPDPRRSIALPASILRDRVTECEGPGSRDCSPRGAFVGRSDSIALLRGALLKTIAGQGENCLVWGPAGIGKTRLIEELIRDASILGAHTEPIACQAGDRKRPLSVFSELSQRLLKLPGALGCAPESYGLLRRLFAPEDSSEPVALIPDASTIFGRVRQALYDILDAVSGEIPLVIIIEDCHWSDEQSTELLADMFDWARRRRLSFLLTSRYNRPPMRGSIETHALGPLDASAVRLLSASLVPTEREIGDATVDRWVRHSQGNPLFVRELAAHWLATGGEDSFPPSLSDLLAQRLRNLSEVSRGTLQAIAVLGRNCTQGRLLTVTEYPGHALIDALNELHHEHLVIGEGDVVRCSHEMVSQAATGQLSSIALKMLHRLAALALEDTIESEADAQLLWDCAQHWQAAGDLDRGLQLNLRCSRQLIELGLPNEAVAMLGAARPLIRSADSSIRLLSGLALALQHAGRWRELHGVLIERCTAAPFGSNAHDDWELLLAEASWRGNHRDPEPILSHAIKCTKAADASSIHRVRAASQGLRIAAECCDRGRGRTLYRVYTELAPNVLLDAALRAEIETVYHTSFGNLDAGATAAGQLIEIWRPRKNPAELARALRFAALPYRLIGKCEEAEASLVESRGLARQYSLRSAEIQAVYRLGVHYLAIRRPDRALQQCSEFVELACKEADQFSRASVGVLAVEALFAVGDSAGATKTYEEIAGFRVADQFVRAAHSFAAVSLRVRLERYTSDVPQEDITALHRLHLLARGMGAEDFASATLFRALAATGAASQALSLFDEYRTVHRRDRIPFEIELADFASRYANGGQVAS